jgi:hypothetical protein
MSLHRTSWVVGCHYYSGVSSVREGQTLSLHREPRNPHDSNAIVVRDQFGVMLGHLSRADAAALAPALDSGTSATAVVEQIQEHPARIRVFVTLGPCATPNKPTPSDHPPSFITAGPKEKKDGLPAWVWIVIVIVILWLLSK